LPPLLLERPPNRFRSNRGTGGVRAVGVDAALPALETLTRDGFALETATALSLYMVEAMLVRARLGESE
jgi:hypothetical protein